MLQPTRYLIYFSSDRPIKPLNLCTSFQVNNTMTEQIECLFTNLLCIMPGFKHLVLIQGIPNAIQLLHQFVCIRCDLFLIIPFGQCSRFQNFKNKYRMMCRQCTPAFCYNIGVRNIILITGIYKSRNRVVNILLNRIIYTTLATR